MIPILFDAGSKIFTSNGLGRLNDCISCLVTEERNGIYELEMQYPVTGTHFSDIIEGNIIVTDHDEQKDLQPFVIYRISKAISGICIINAHHISYTAANVIISPFSASSIAEAFNGIEAHSMTVNPFTLWTDKTSSGSFEVSVPSPLKAILGGQRGSVLDAFGGGEYEWDNYTIKLYANRGSDSGITIRYGKNLTGLQAERNTLDLYNVVIPYWTDNEDSVVYGGVVIGNGGIGRRATWTNETDNAITDENRDEFEFWYYIQQATTMDLTSYFEEAPTVEELEARAKTILNNNKPWIPKDNIKIDFVALWQTEEYKDIAPLERVRLCDTVSVYYPELGVDAKSKVISVVWDCLLERYDSIELGTAKTSFAEVMEAETDEKLENVPSISMMDEAISHAASLITGGMGGHIVFLYDADGKPTDMLVMDTEDVNTAVNVLRINVNGIGFSSNGVSGTYRSAWTLDGSFVADFITAGTLSANRIFGGTLKLGGDGNENGSLLVYDADGNEIGRWDKDGAKITGDLSIESLNISYDIQNRPAIVTSATGFFSYSHKVPGLYALFGDDGSAGICESIESFEGKTVASTSAFLASGMFLVEELPSKSGINVPLVCGSADVVSQYGRSDWPGRLITLDDGNGEGSYISLSLNGFLAKGDSFSGTTAKQLAEEPEFPVVASERKWTVSVGDSGILLSTGVKKSWHYLRINDEHIDIDFKKIAFESFSSKRYKHSITDKISADLDAHKLYDLRMKQFVFNDDRPLQYEDMKGKTIPGFIAEEVAEIYPAAAIKDRDGNIESWDERRIIPGMLKLIQEQRDEIEMLKERVAKLEKLVEEIAR